MVLQSWQQTYCDKVQVQACRRASVVFCPAWHTQQRPPSDIIVSYSWHSEINADSLSFERLTHYTAGTNINSSKYPTDSKVQAGLQMSIHGHLFQQAILTHKVGRTDLVFGVERDFTSSSVHARLQVSVCSGYHLCHCGWPKIGCFTFWSL